MAFKRSNNPNVVLVAYNGAGEGLCEIVLNTSIKKRHLQNKVRDVDEYGLSPVVVSGTLVPPALYPLVNNLFLPICCRS